MPPRLPGIVNVNPRAPIAAVERRHRKVKTRELVSPLIKVFALRLILELSGDLNIPCKLPANVGDY